VSKANRAFRQGVPREPNAPTADGGPPHDGRSEHDQPRGGARLLRSRSTPRVLCGFQWPGHECSMLYGHAGPWHQADCGSVHPIIATGGSGGT